MSRVPSSLAFLVLARSGIRTVKKGIRFPGATEANVDDATPLSLFISFWSASRLGWMSGLTETTTTLCLLNPIFIFSMKLSCRWMVKDPTIISAEIANWEISNVRRRYNEIAPDLPEPAPDFRICIGLNADKIVAG